MEHELELSTGFAVGFCYHKAADLRVCQAAHSLSCVRSCSALLQSVGTVHLEILNKLLTVPSRVWSLTGHEPLRWDRPRRLFDLVQFLSGVWIRLDQIRTSCERFWTASGLHSVTVSALGALSLPVQPILRIFRAGGVHRLSLFVKGHRSRALFVRITAAERAAVQATGVEFSVCFSGVC